MQCGNKLNGRLKSSLRYTVVFLLGLSVGSFLLETLEFSLRQAYRNPIIRTNLETEQEFLAACAVRDNKQLQSVSYRQVIVTSEINGVCERRRQV